MKAPLALLYHAAGQLPQAAPYRERALFVHPSAFAEQMDYFKEKGYRSLTLDEYIGALEGRKSSDRRFLITFDDGYAHVDEVVTPILQQHGFTAVMFIPWAHVGDRNVWDASNQNLSSLRIMTEGQLKALESGPWEVASHGAKHVDLRRQHSDVRRRELAEARERLSELLGRKVQALAYPYGYQDAGVREDARAAGFRVAFTATGYGVTEWFRIPRRPIAGWDAQPLFRLKTAASAPWIYRAEDAARVPFKLRNVARAGPAGRWLPQ
jgi:peptidoglycan/xylan/chitin deacetylase (PgdA/CDA1 family)